MNWRREKKKVLFKGNAAKKLLAALMAVVMCMTGGIWKNERVDAAASGAPGKPQIQIVQSAEGDYEISVNMWWGDNATSYTVYEKKGKQGEYQSIAQGSLEDNSPYAQSFSVNIAKKTMPGTYWYLVELKNNFGTTKGDEKSIEVGGTGSSKITIDEIDANEVVNQFVTTQGKKTYKISFTETENPEFQVVSSNTSVVEANIVNNDTLEINAKQGGRSGIKLVEKNTKETRNFGVRVRESDGSLKDMPSYLAVGQVSEDSTEDLSFWKSTSNDDTNKRMDVRYIYINGGPIQGWQSWSGNEPEKRVKSYIIESLKLGMVPYFVYYNIPDGSESYDVDKKHINDMEYMEAYYKDLTFFLETCKKYDCGETVGIVLEPDFIGYMMQNANASPENISASGVEAAYTSGILTKGVDPTFPNNVRGLIESINYIIHTKYPTANFGWQFNTWSYSDGVPSNGLMHATETMGFEKGRSFIENAAKKTAQYYMSAGILEYGAKFISIDKYGLDGAYQSGAAENPASSNWLWNSDVWNNYLYYTKTLHETTKFPVTLWQIPVGHLNHSLENNPYNGGQFADLPNKEKQYEDSAPDYFFGDTFTPGSAARLKYFSTNEYNDSKVTVNGNTVTYGSHMEEARDAGVTCILFGAGVGSSTDAVGAPPTDDYWWITKAQRYFKNPVKLNIKSDAGEQETTEQVTEPETSKEEQTTKRPETTSETTPETTKKEETTEGEIITNPGVTINGYQISATTKGIRTVYSVENNINNKAVVERGMVYGLSSYITDSDLYVQSKSDYVKHFSATDKGKLDRSFSQSQTADSYAMTMKFAANTKAEFEAGWSVRAYAKLSDGTYVYSDVKKYTIYDVANELYTKSMMSGKQAHDYLYEGILKVCNDNYPKVEYDWNSTLAK